MMYLNLGRRSEMYQSFGPIMEKYDFFICPTTNIPAVSAEHDPTASNFTIEGAMLRNTDGF